MGVAAPPGTPRRPWKFVPTNARITSKRWRRSRGLLPRKLGGVVCLWTSARGRPHRQIGDPPPKNEKLNAPIVTRSQGFGHRFDSPRHRRSGNAEPASQTGNARRSPTPQIHAARRPKRDKVFDDLRPEDMRHRSLPLPRTNRTGPISICLRNSKRARTITTSRPCPSNCPSR